MATSLVDYYGITKHKHHIVFIESIKLTIHFTYDFRNIRVHLVPLPWKYASTLSDAFFISSTVNIGNLIQSSLSGSIEVIAR